MSLLGVTLSRPGGTMRAGNLTPNLVACSAPGCRQRLAPWSGWWGSSKGHFVNSEWYCSLDCVATGLERWVASARSSAAPREPVLHGMPIGLILMARGMITHEQLKAALADTSNPQPLIGRRLRDIAGLAEDEITSAIAAQWSCPVYPARSIQEDCEHRIPVELIERYRILPVHYSSSVNRLWVGFAQRVNRSLLCVLEQMFDCHTEACIINNTQFNMALERLRRAQKEEHLIQTFCPAHELSNLVCNYAGKIRGSSIRHAACDDSLWLRVEGRNALIDLLFSRFNSSMGNTKEAALGSR